MPASQQMGVVEISDGASTGDIHVAAYQNCAHRRAWYQRFRLLVVADRTGAHNRNDSGRGKIFREEANRFFAEPGEDQWSLDGLQQVRIAWVLLIRSGQARSRSSSCRLLVSR